jgi:hypothetical protein
MRPLRLTVVALLAFPLGSAGQGADDRPWSSLERERWVRQHALVPGDRRASLEAALEAEDWTRRAAALEALRRAWALGEAPGSDPVSGRVMARVVALACDPDAPERATALAALARAPSPPQVPDEALDQAMEGAPAVALALARLLERVEPGQALPRLAALAGHLDERVREAALDALAARADAAEALAAAVASLAGAEPADGAFLAGLERLERSGAEPAALDELARRLEARDGLDVARRRSALCGVEAVRLIVHGRGDLDPLVSGWVAPGSGPLRRQALLLRAARAARAAGLPLCAALLDAAPRSEAPRVLLEGAVEAAPAHEVVTLAARRPAFSGALGVTLWELLAGRAARWDAPVVAPWLAPGQDAELRLAVAEAVSLALAASGDEASAGLLAGLLGDPDEELDRLAFRSLSGGADPAPWLEALHSAWATHPWAERARRLRWLPRTQPLGPFRADLLELGEEDLTARGACAELLGPWRDEPDVAARLARWLDEDLQRLRTTAGGDAAAEARAVALVRALGGEGLRARERRLLVELVAGADEAVLAPAKTAVAVLAPLDGGEVTLEAFLANEELLRRLRIEAALRRTPAGSARALEVLEQGYAGCDAVLRGRIVRAATARRDAPATRLLRRVALDPHQPAELRALAIDGLAAHGAREALTELLASERHPDVRAALLAGLAAVGDEPARETLLALFSAVEAGALPVSPEELAAERETVLAALAACRAWSPALGARWLARPLAAADGDLRARLRGERLAPPPFRFRGELALGAARAEQGRLAAALAAAGAWWSVDGRLLGHLGVAALPGEPATAALVLRAGWIALAGEADADDGPELRFELRRRLLAAAEARRDWERVATLSEELASDWRARRLPQRAFEAAYGELDPAAGIDPRGRLVAAALQARAWAAHEAEDAPSARAFAARARASLGHSRDALRAQESLEAALGGR